jgi:hypothetical protein
LTARPPYVPKSSIALASPLADNEYRHQARETADVVERRDDQRHLSHLGGDERSRMVQIHLDRLHGNQRASLDPRIPRACRVTTTEAAAALGISPQRVRTLLGAGKLWGRKVGRDWWVDEESVARRLSEMAGR